jgi:hypothetical protein
LKNILTKKYFVDNITDTEFMFCKNVDSRGFTMKKFNWFVLTKVFFVVVFCVIISVEMYAQSSNNEQRIVGTWSGNSLHTGGDGGAVTWIFNSNGTGKGGFDDSSFRSFRYGISSDKLIIVFDERSLFSLPAVYDYFFSPDGTLFLYRLDYMGAESQDMGFVLVGGTVVTLRKSM